MHALHWRLHESLLSSLELLHEYCGGAPLEQFKGETMLRLARITVRRRTDYLPDPQYINPQKKLYGERPTVAQLLRQALHGLAEAFLDCREGRVHARWKRFQAWQELLTYVPPLPLVAAALHRHGERLAMRDKTQLVRQAVRHSALPRMGAPALEDVLAQRGLAEPHLHLNGSSETDTVWHYALARPYETYKDLQRSANKDPGVQDLLRQLAHFLTPYKFYRLLLTAAWLRQRLVGYLGDKPMPAWYEIQDWLNIHSVTPPDRLYLSEKHPFRDQLEPELRGDTSLSDEAQFLVQALEELPEAPETFALALHCYLLIQSCHHRLLVQQKTQNGFDQFQHITDNKLRDPLEGKQFTSRFHQLLEHLPGPACHLEGRFSPKPELPRMVGTLKKINKFWDEVRSQTEYCKESPQLVFTAHFIKQRDKAKQRFLCRHRQLRREIERIARALAVSKERFSKELPLCAVDAAANEMHAPPEVFAPVYRFLRSRGWHNFTYHVGEDFVHLASGLRAVGEALEFLELGYKDRIGHGTAIGIDPAYWQCRSGGAVTLWREEWLDDLVFLYWLLREQPDPQGLMPLLKGKAEEQAQLLYDEAVPLVELMQAWHLRRHDPLLVFNDDYLPVDPFFLREYELAEADKQRHLRAWQRFRDYHQSEKLYPKQQPPAEAAEPYRSEDGASHTFTEAGGNVLLCVQADELPLPLYDAAQRELVKRLKARRVAVEIMPTSNVRIACYDGYDKHHLFRFLGLGENPLPEHPDLVLASDDPGIFATSLRNE